MNVANNKGDFECETKQELEELIRKSALNPYDDIWINEEEEEYPCLTILVNGQHACVHYFEDEGEMWQSVGDCKQDILFSANNEKPEPMPGDCVISLDKAIECMKIFFDSCQRPDCIEWREM